MNPHKSLHGAYHWRLLRLLRSRNNWAAQRFLFGSLILLAVGTTFASAYLLRYPSVNAQEVESAAVDIDYAVTTQDLDQTRPVAVFNAITGEYLVVYEHDYSISNTDIDILARRIGRDGSPASIPFTVVQSGYQELHPDIAVNASNGDYLVVWEHVTSASNHDIKALRMSSAGVPGSVFPWRVDGTTSEAYPPSSTTPRATSTWWFGSRRASTAMLSAASV